MSNSPPQTIGFIGTGVMGASMAGRLLNAGCTLHVHNRTRSKAQPLLDHGATWHDQPGEIAEACPIVFTIVGYPDDVEQVYLGQAGLVAHAKPGSVLVDMTTSRPDLAERIAEEASRRQVRVLDAPVSGGDRGAREGTVTIMVGGDAEAFEQVRPLFDVMGGKIVHQGRAGAGQHTKMANQIAIAGNILGVCEALGYVEQAGLDPETVLESIGGGAAGSWTMSNLGPRMIEGDDEPGFYVEHFIKDLGIACELARHMNLEAPGLELALQRYQQLAEAGHGRRGTQALIKLYRQQRENRSD